MSFGLLKQKLIGGGDELPLEFKGKRQHLSTFSEPLEHCKNAIEEWIKMLQKLSNCALYFQNNLPGDMQFAGANLHGDIKDGDVVNMLQVAAHSAASKQKFVLAALKRSEEVEAVLLAKNRAKRKLEEAQKKGGQALAKAENEMESAKWNFNDVYADVISLFDYIIDCAHDRGGYGLALDEMKALKSSQLTVFSNSKQVIEGNLDDQDVLEIGLQDVLEGSWDPFQSFLAKKDLYVAEKRTMELEGPLRAAGVCRLQSASDGSSFASASSSPSSSSFHSRSRSPSATSSINSQGILGITSSRNLTTAPPPPPPPPPPPRTDLEGEETCDVQTIPPLPPKPHRKEMSPRVSQPQDEQEEDGVAARRAKIQERIDLAFEVGESKGYKAFIDRNTGDSFWVNFDTWQVSECEP